MKRAIKEYYREKALKKDIETEAILRIREHRLKIWKLLSFALLSLNFSLMTFLFVNLTKTEYETMSGGYEVHIRDDVSFSQLDQFLRRHNLFIKGPTPEGTYLIEGASSDTIKAIEKSNIFRPKD